MEKLVDVMNPGHRFEFRELLAFAGSHGLFERLIPENENDPKASAKRSALSLLWKGFSGRNFWGNLQILYRWSEPKNPPLLC
jgi:hypothetical protein